MKLTSELQQDVRFAEGLKSCMNCGVCTAICPAAEFFDYDPRMLVGIVQSKDEMQLIELLRSDSIWLCGQCMSCKTRCPRGNCPGLIISVLRTLSQKHGFFTESILGRQQYAIAKIIGGNILRLGYCIHPSVVEPALHPEQGPVWKWIYDNQHAFYERMGARLDESGAGTLRRIPEEALDELRAIFEVSGGNDFINSIERFSVQKAGEMGFETDEKGMEKYLEHVLTNNENHLTPTS